MKQTYKKLMAFGRAAVGAAISGCQAPKAPEPAAGQPSGGAEADSARPSTQEEPADQEEPAGQPEKVLEIGDVVSGFTVDSLSDSEMLQARLMGFTHKKSGAKGRPRRTGSTWTGGSNRTDRANWSNGTKRRTRQGRK